MFDRGSGDKGPAAVEVTLGDGRKLQGRILPAERSLTEILNSATPFIELKLTDGERMFIAKSAVQCVMPQIPSRPPILGTDRRNGAGSNPGEILHVAPGASRAEVHQAYIRLAKLYHPDRYAAVELPPEVRDYLAAMARRINAAHEALDRGAHKHAEQEEPIFTHAGHGQ